MLGMLGVRGEGVGVSKSATDCRGEPLSRRKLARSPEGVSATETLDRDEDGTWSPAPAPAWCDCNCEFDCDCERECARRPPLCGVTGPATRGGIGGGGDGGTGDNETRGGVWTAEDARATNEGEPVAALET